MTLTKLFYNCAYKIKYETAGNDVNYAFVEQKDTLYIYFECSSSAIDWVRNFWFTEKPYKTFKVHRGFYEAYSEVRDIILDKAYSKHYEEIIIVGYSHGGGLCYLAHEDLKYHFPNTKITTYAFESPRCIKAPKECRDMWEGFYLIKNNNDLITHLPPRLFGYLAYGFNFWCW